MAYEKVLIVEDENIVALDLKRRLSKLGYNVIGMASNAIRAQELVKDHLPDIVLMDIHIKGHTDGIDTARSIQDDYQIPVIFLTAYSEEATLNRAKTSNPYGYLLKPYSERELHAGIQMALEKSQADRRIRKSQAHLQMALNAGKLTTWEINGQTDSVILSYTPNGRLSDVTNWETLSRMIVPSDIERVARKIETLKILDNREIEVDFEVIDPELGHRWLAMFGKSYNQEASRQIVGVLQDITERRLVEENLKQAALVYRCSADGIVILNDQHKVKSANQAFYRITGLDASSTLNRELELLSPENIGQELIQELKKNLDSNGFWQGEIKTFRQNHELLYAWVNISLIPDSISTFGQYVIVISDITEIRNAQEKLSQIAYYDSVTNLPNRNLFMDRLDLALAKAKRDNKQMAILFLDLDHFKRVNDTLGHQVGDIMLRSVAQRLKAELRATDTLCRIGGDEFIVIIEKFNALEDLNFLAGKLLSALDLPLELGSTEVVPHASIGISIYPNDSTDRDDLIKMADTAMYSAKNSGRSRHAFYQTEMTIKTEHYMNRERELRLALQNNEFIMHYQPQYDAKTSELSGLEALIRWQHPELGMVSAAEIIPIAEMSDLIISIGKWVLNEVCRQYREWLAAGITPPRTAINISPRQLLNNHFVRQIADAMAKHQVPPQAIEIEITESCLQDNDVSVRCLRELEKLGVTISIDDFGTGYSCLSSLKTLPIHRLKIDQAFVRDIPEDESDCAIASAIIALGQQLNLQVVAEGIETKEQADFMCIAGCNELQGYLFSRPVPASEIFALLTSQQSKTQLH